METIATLLIYLSGMAGIFGHWCVLKVRSKSQDSLWTYLRENFEYTIASLAMGIGSSSTLLTLLMPGMSLQQIIVLMGSAFSAGLAADAAINKGSQPEPGAIEVQPEIKVIEAKTHENDDLNALLGRHHQS